MSSIIGLIVGGALGTLLGTLLHAAHKPVIQIIDDSRRGEAVRVYADGELVATFPSHSASKVKALTEFLGFAAFIETKQGGSHGRPDRRRT